MIPHKETTRLSKLLSYVLRHNPAEIGIEMDEQGWTDVPLLLQKLADYGEVISLALLRYIVETNNKKRFAFNDDGTKIRASQGHSIEVALDYAPQQPPAILYHGTVADFIAPIKTEGLKKMDRHHVHLSADEHTAIKVAQRKGKPVILTINACEMYLQGLEFYMSDNGVWLTEAVPAGYITFPV